MDNCRPPASDRGQDLCEDCIPADRVSEGIKYFDPSRYSEITQQTENVIQREARENRMKEIDLMCQQQRNEEMGLFSTGNCGRRAPTCPPPFRHNVPITMDPTSPTRTPTGPGSPVCTRTPSPERCNEDDFCQPEPQPLDVCWPPAERKKCPGRQPVTYCPEDAPSDFGRDGCCD